MKNKSNTLATKLETLHNLIYETLGSCKNKYIQYISKRLCSKVITPKYYGSLLKTVLNDKKNSCIMFIIYDDKFLQVFIFYRFLFLQSCAQLLKMTLFFLHQLVSLATYQYLSNFEFTKDVIENIIVNPILIKLMIMT